MSMNISTTRAHIPTRIEGRVTLTGDTRETPVIAFSKIMGEWITSYSMCLPKNAADAEKIIECYSAALAKLNEIKSQEK